MFYWVMVLIVYPVMIYNFGFLKGTGYFFVLGIVLLISLLLIMFIGGNLINLYERMRPGYISTKPTTFNQNDESNIDSNDPYNILGVNHFDNEKTIQKRYRKLLTKANNNPVQMKKIQTAYEEIKRIKEFEISNSDESSEQENLKQEYIKKYGRIEGLRKYYQSNQT